VGNYERMMMMKKGTIIQFLAVFTLVLGNMYQGVSAMASGHRSQVEIESAMLVDKDDQMIHQTVREGDGAKLAFDLAITNQDGEQPDGKAELSVSDSQLLLSKKKQRFTVSNSDAVLSFEYIRRTKKYELSWQNVEGTTTFNVSLPLVFGATMSVDQPEIMIGSEKANLQAISIAGKDADEKELAESDSILEALPSGVMSREDVVAAAKEAKEKLDKEAAEAKAKQEKEAEEAKAKKAEQEKAARQKEQEKQKEAAKKAESSAKAESNAKAKEGETAAAQKSATRESSSDDEDGEGEGGETPTDPDPVNIRGKFKNSNDTLFSSIFVTVDGQESQEISENNSLKDLSAAESIALRYEFDLREVMEKKLDQGETIDAGDEYKFTIEGFDFNSNNKSGDIFNQNNEKIGSYQIESPTNKDNPLEVTLTFTEDAIRNGAEGHLTIMTTYSGSGGKVDFEAEAGGQWLAEVKEADISLSKSEEWNDDDTITWKVDINSTSKTAFTELTLQDEIVLGETLGAHSFIKDEDGKMWSVVEKPSGVEVEEEVGVGENSNGQLKIRNFAAGKITLTVKTRIDRNSFKDSTFGNKVVLTGTGLPDNGQLEDTATVSNVNLRLKKQFVKADGDNFNWQVNFNTVGIVDPTGWDLNETLTGPHKFVDEESFVLIDQDGNKIDRTVTIAVDGKSAVIKLTGSDENLTGKFFTLTYQTQYDPDFTPGANESSTTVNNKVTWSKGVPGEDDEIGDAGNEVGIGEKNISASSLADRTVDWEITYNLNKYEVKKGSIVDTLPGGFTLVDVVNPQNSVSIKDDEGNDISSDNYTVALEGNKVTINFINPGVISKKTLLVTINSKYDPEDKNLEALSKNKATLSMNGQTQDVYADFQIPKIIHANGFKDGTVNIPDQDYSKAYVRWRIGINTHALDTWTNGQVIKIDDVLNDGGQNYLSFDGDQDFKLYAQQLGPTGLGDEIELTEDQYEITNDDAGNITITLINVGNFDKSSLRLDFNTPIDFGDKKLESDKWTFKNNADITYGSEVDKRKLKVSAEVSHANSGFYIDKRHISTTGGTIKWQSVINGGGKNLEEYDNVTITDTMAEGLSFLNSTSNPIELYEAQMNSAGQYESTGKKVGTDSYSLEPVDGGEGFKIVFDKDYRVTSPLILTYYSQVEKKMEAYKNTIKLSYTGSEFDAEDEIKSEHFGAGHFTRFALNLTKVDANDGKPLEGAEFKVQRAKFRNGVTPTDADFEDFVVNDKVMEGTTDINGRLNFGQLDSMDWYRVVEVTPPGGYQPGYISELHRWSGSGNPSIKSEVKNNELKYGTLQIKKTVSNPGTTNDTFDFEVIGRGPNLEDGTPELLNGDFKATFYEKDGVAVTRSVTFEGGKLKNGIKLKDGEQLFIQGLETRFKFDITE